MFKGKVLAVVVLMVVGKLLILGSGSTAFAGPVVRYQTDPFDNYLREERFGWFKKLNEEQNAAYFQAVTHAVTAAENGEEVAWYKQNASGRAIPLVTWPNSTGYCRTLHVETIAFNRRNVRTVTACYSTATRSWRWVSDK